MVDMLALFNAGIGIPVRKTGCTVAPSSMNTTLLVPTWAW
jgi:hypothetical protein